jgi:hypothetical protein
MWWNALASRWDGQWAQVYVHFDNLGMVTKKFWSPQVLQPKSFDQIATSMVKINPPLIKQIKIYFHHCKLSGYQLLNL